MVQSKFTKSWSWFLQTAGSKGKAALFVSIYLFVYPYETIYFKLRFAIYCATDLTKIRVKNNHLKEKKLDLAFRHLRGFVQVSKKCSI